MSTASSVRPRTGGWPLALVMAICALVYVANLDALQIGQHVDDGVYVSVGRSLAAGLGYVRYEDPRHPVEPQYPPALPALIALAIRLGTRLETLRIIPLIFALASLPLADLFFRSRLSCVGVSSVSLWRWVLLVLYGLNSLVVGYAGIVMSEAPFICLTLATLVLLTRPPVASARVAQRARFAAMLSAVLVAASLFRTAGLALALGSVAWLSSRKRHREALATAALTIILLAPWLIFQHRATGYWFGAGYGVDVVSAGHSHWPQVLRPVENLFVYSTRLFPQALLPCFGERVTDLLARLSLEPVALLLGLAVTAAVVVGGVICARRRSLPDGWLALSLVLLLLVWPYRYTRFVLPLVPIALVYLLAAGIALAPRRRNLLLGVAGLAVAGFLARDVAMTVDPPRIRYPDLRAAGQFVSAHTEPDALIVADNAPGIALYAQGRPVLDPLPIKGEAARYPSVVDTIRSFVAARSVYVLVRGERPVQPDLFAPGVPELSAELVATDSVHNLHLYLLAANASGASP